MRTQLVYTATFYVFYMFSIAIYTLRSRVRAIASGEVSHKYFKAYTGQPPSERTLLIGRHYDNQFQVPMLFLIVCAMHAALTEVTLTTLILAWIFIAARVGHTFVHLGSNALKKRVATFALSWLAVLALWAQLAYNLPR